VCATAIAIAMHAAWCGRARACSDRREPGAMPIGRAGGRPAARPFAQLHAPVQVVLHTLLAASSARAAMHRHARSLASPPLLSLSSRGPWPWPWPPRDTPSPPGRPGHACMQTHGHARTAAVCLRACVTHVWRSGLRGFGTRV
jgi:hypothetical protein